MNDDVDCNGWHHEITRPVANTACASIVCYNRQSMEIASPDVNNTPRVHAALHAHVNGMPRHADMYVVIMCIALIASCVLLPSLVNRRALGVFVRACDTQW